MSCAALDAVEKQVGKMSGHPIDSNKYRAQNEKFTDKVGAAILNAVLVRHVLTRSPFALQLRALVEKYTGKKIPAKYSN